MARVLVPWPVTVVPDDVGLIVWDGQGDPPDGVDEVEFYVMPYNRPAAVDLLGRLPKLRALQILTAGYDAVAGRVPDGVVLLNAAGLHDASTAEHALGLMLAAQRDLPRWAVDQSRHVWDRHFTRSLAGSRVLIVGYGNIGRAIEARLEPFEVTVTRLANRARDDARGTVHGAGELHDLLPAADVVVLVLPDSAATRGIVGASELALLPDDALVVNVGRGSALDADALLAEGGRIRAALDVAPVEPLPADHPLWDAPGVFLTPHVAGGSATFYPRAVRFVDEQIERWLAGEPLQNVVHP